MTLADYALAAFVLVNAGHAAAQLPQIARVYRMPRGGSAFAPLPWTLLAAANIATVGYALANSHDHIMAAVFALNAAACLAIATLAIGKRLDPALRRPDLHQWVASVRDRPLAASEAAYPRDSLTPSAKHRDEMIRQGLYG